MENHRYVKYNANIDRDILTSLSRVSIHDLSVKTNTSLYYIQGKVRTKFKFFISPNRKIQKFILEDESGETINVLMTDIIAEEGQHVNEQDIMALTGFKVLFTSHSTSDAPFQTTSDYQILVYANPDAHVWVQSHRINCDRNSRSTSSSLAITAPVHVNVPPSKCLPVKTSATNVRSVDHSDVDNSGCTHAQVSTSATSVDPSTDRAGTSAQPCTSQNKDNSQIRTSHKTSKNLPKSDTAADQQKKAPTNYVYVKINDLKAGTTVNVFGVVKYAREPVKTRGLDYNMLLSLVDESLQCGHDKLKCMLFARELNSLPQVNVGDVIRLHRLKIASFNSELQGQNGPGFAWLAFDSTSVAADVHPKHTCSRSFTLTDSDKQRVAELSQWASSDDSVLSQELSAPALTGTSLSDVNYGIYFDLTCQVAATCIVSPGVSLLLRVWDGTKLGIPAFEQDMSIEECQSRIIADSSLLHLAQDYIVDVWVYDEYFVKAQTLNIKPGDFVRITNLHAMVHKWTDADPFDRTIPRVELSLHGGGQKFHRDIVVLDVASTEAQNLRRVLDEHPQAEDTNDSLNICRESVLNVQGPTSSRHVAPASDVQGPTSSRRVAPASDVEPDSVVNDNSKSTTSGKRSSPQSLPANAKKCRPTVVVEDMDVDATLESGEDCCLQKTATVITDNFQAKPTCLHEITTHKPPYKFRAVVNVIDYQPRPSKPSEMVQLYCEICEFRSPLPDASASDQELLRLSAYLDHEEDGIEYFRCPNCSRSAQKNQSETRILSHIYMFTFLLRDDTGWLQAGLWKDEAVKFFHGVQPTDLLRSNRIFQELHQKLDALCARGQDDTSDTEPDNVQSLEKMDCCLMSYSIPCGTGYQIFDTTLSQE